MVGDAADHTVAKADRRGIDHAGTLTAGRVRSPEFRHREVVIASVPSLIDLLTLEEIDTDLYRSGTLYPDPRGLFGGQVAAQALRAAGHTVDPDRPAHSLHGYFLRPGDPSRPVVFEVHRDRDGRSYSARRVVARQGGKVVLNLAASFHRPEGGPDLQAEVMPDEAVPEIGSTAQLEADTVGIDFFEAVGARPAPAGQPADERARPSRVWARSQIPVPADPHLHACVLTYLSDILTGLTTLTTPSPDLLLTSLDHAIWFHRPADLNDWVLMDLTGHSIAAGRGMYSGRLFSRDGRLVAGLTQESLFRPGPGGRPGPRRIRRKSLT